MKGTQKKTMKTMTVSEMGRLGAYATNSRLTKAQRIESARHAVNTRWARVREEQARKAKKR